MRLSCTFKPLNTGIEELYIRFCSGGALIRSGTLFRENTVWMNKSATNLEPFFNQRVNQPIKGSSLPTQHFLKSLLKLIQWERGGNLTSPKNEYLEGVFLLSSVFRLFCLFTGVFFPYVVAFFCPPP